MTEPQKSDHPAEPKLHEGITLRPHTYDGIQEYDQRLPNWWLWTLYGAIIFSFAYWFICHQMKLTASPEVAVTQEIERNTLSAAKRSGVVTNEMLWKFSRDPAFVAAGRTTVESTCAACHKPDLSGAIGPSLVDETWLYGGEPLQIMNSITNGSTAKGMPAWGPLLGKSKITEVTAYILSLHKLPESESAPPAEPIP